MDSEPPVKKKKVPTSDMDSDGSKPCPPEKPRKSAKDKKRQAALTLHWLDENYCACDGVCLPRCILYSHYLDFCQLKSLEPACAATFGKTIRQKFPHITTRRLGTRGHSKYHYYGIGIKESSQYYHTVYSGTGLTRFSGSKFINEGGFTRKYSLASKMGTILPDFMDPRYLNLPPNIDVNKICTLMVMYRTHCQCILDAVISGHFLEVPTFLLHFWRGLPQHLYPLVHHTVTVDLLAASDSLLYKVLIDVLVPSTMQEMPESLLADIKVLAQNWESWVHNAINIFPTQLQDKKLAMAARFAQSLQRQASFLHLAQTVRPVLYDSQEVNKIIADVDQVEIEAPVDISSVASSNIRDSTQQFHETMLVQLREILHKQATVEAFTEWLDVVLDQHMVKPSNGSNKIFRRKAQEILNKWSYFGSQVTKSLTSNAAASLDSYQLIRHLLDEYVLLVIESQIHQEHDDDLHIILDRYAVQEPSMYFHQPSTTDVSYGNNSYNMETSQNHRHDDQIIQSHQLQAQHEGTWTPVHSAAADFMLTPPSSPSIAPWSNQYKFNMKSHYQHYHDTRDTWTVDHPAIVPVSSCAACPVDMNTALCRQNPHCLDQQEKIHSQSYLPPHSAAGLSEGDPGVIIPCYYETFENTLPAINSVLP